MNEADRVSDLTEKYANEVERNSQYRHFDYYVNSIREQEHAPKALVFQGSYINGMGYKFLQNGFGEYVSVHDYQNILNFEYYVNIFNPDCIVFDAAEYTFSNQYFDYQKMLDFKLNPLLLNFKDYEIKQAEGKFVTERGETLTKVKVMDSAPQCEYAYMVSRILIIRLNIL